MTTCQSSLIFKPLARAAVSALMCGVVVSAVGCGSSDKLPTYPLTVRVTYAGDQPLAGATVVFRSAEHKVTATGKTKEDGACAMGTYAPGDGVVAGKQRASVVMQTPPGDPDEVRRTVTVPLRLSSPDTSGLEYLVTEDGPSEITIEIPSK
jgi:hypothetical protein